MTSVLLVDDQQLMRAGFRVILESEPGITVVGDAANGTDAIRLARELSPDVICMDVQMPGMDGLEATRILVADAAITGSILMLTTFDRDDYLFEALRAGASGFLLKTASPESFIEAVQVLARGDALLSPQVTRRVIERFAGSSEDAAEGVAPDAGGRDARDRDARDQAANDQTAPGHPVVDPGFGRTRFSTLTERETEVLALVAQGRSNAEIAGALFVGEATVKTHVSSMLMKLGVRDRIQAVVYAYENGFAVRGGGAPPREGDT